MEEENKRVRSELIELLKGGFAPVVPLLREFHYNKAGVVLDGLHFSAFSLLGHMHHRQQIFLKFIQDPNTSADLWPEAYWPQKFNPDNEEEWNNAINKFEIDLNAIIDLVSDPSTDIMKANREGKTIHWAAIALLQHNGYHIGQMKTIGRQLGVW